MHAPAFDRRALAWGLARLAGIVLIVVLVIVSVPGLGALRSRFARTQASWIIASAALQVGAVLGFVVAFQRAFADWLAPRSSAALAMTAQAVNVLVPAGGAGGPAAAALMMSRAGVPRGVAASRMIALFVVTSVLVNVLLLVVGGFGVWGGALPGHTSWATSLLPAGLAVLLTVAVVYATRRMPERRGLRSLREGLVHSGQLLRTRDPLLVLGALAFIGLDLGALAAAFHALGSGGLPLGTLLLAYTLGQVGSVVSLPGTTEGGLIGVFALYGTPLALATSAILAYRAVQSLVPLAFGAVGLTGLRRGIQLR
jgi:uncharacterized membrane protein YbhN (UPF0104 family)